MRWRWAVLAMVAAVAGGACGGTGASRHSGAAGAPPPQPGSARPAAVAGPGTAAHHRARHHAATQHPHRRRHRHRITTGLSGIPAADLPDRALTPGAVLTESTIRVCTPGYASSVRHVPQSESDAVYARYGVVHVPYQHEVDHLVSLELGGSNAISNLWPEPYAGRWGAQTKDALENRLHDLVCAGVVGLRYAQRIEASDWVAAYRRYIGAPPAAAPTGAGGGGAAPTGSGCTPGYSPCLPEHGGADYDCAGGGGNGPYFTSAGVTYRVTGSDPYRLDGNGDGYAC